MSIVGRASFKRDLNANDILNDKNNKFGRPSLRGDNCPKIENLESVGANREQRDSSRLLTYDYTSSSRRIIAPSGMDKSKIIPQRVAQEEEKRRNSRVSQYGLPVNMTFVDMPNTRQSIKDSAVGIRRTMIRDKGSVVSNSPHQENKFENNFDLNNRESQVSLDRVDNSDNLSTDRSKEEFEEKKDDNDFGAISEKYKVNKDDSKKTGKLASQAKTRNEVLRCSNFSQLKASGNQKEQIFKNMESIIKAGITISTNNPL